MQATIKEANTVPRGVNLFSLPLFEIAESFLRTLGVDIENTAVFVIGFEVSLLVLLTLLNDSVSLFLGVGVALVHVLGLHRLDGLRLVRDVVRGADLCLVLVAIATLARLAAVDPKPHSVVDQVLVPHMSSCSMNACSPILLSS